MGHRWKRLRRVSVTEPGTNYQEKPAITVSEPTADKMPAAVTPTMDGDKVSSITVDSGGNFYNTPPTVTISPPDQLSGTQATAAAILTNGEVSAINVTDSGSGYTSTPTVTVAKSTDPKSDFAATLSLNFDSSTGTVTSISVVDSGNFYDENNPPNISIDAPFPNQNFEIGEDVTISGIDADSTAATVTGEVAQWVESSGKLTVIHVANDTADFVEPTANSIVTAEGSGASSNVTKVENPEIAGDISDEFDDQAADFLDFSESNPFGEPEAATVAQEAASIVTPDSTPTEAIIKGTKSDPAFDYPLEYKIIANGVDYQYNATGEDERNYFEGIRGLNVPGLTIGVYSDTGVTNGIQVKYTPQVDGDTIKFAGSGWTHLGILEGEYGVTGDRQDLAPGDSATPQAPSGGGGIGDSADIIDSGYMSDSAYATRVAQSSTSTVWDSAAVDLGLEKIRFESKYSFTSADVTGTLYQPRGITFGDNGRKLFYVSGGSYPNTAYVYGMKLNKPYDVSSINFAESAASLNLDTHFHDIFDGGYSGQYSENNMIDVWFNPQGTKMWVNGNTYDTVIQFALDSAWNLNGTITPEHKLGTGYMSDWTTRTAINNWVYDSNLQMSNFYSNEWIDSGRTLISTSLSSRGDTIKQTFSTPYDISTCTSSGLNYYRHTQYTDSDSDGLEYANDALKLAFNSGSVFNYDGSEMYFIHQQFDSDDYDSGGNGLNGWRVNLVKATLSAPYDITTMSFDRQVEITNLADSPGGPTNVKPSGKMGIHPNGRRFYMMSYASESAGVANYSDFNLWEFSTQPDSAGSPAITTPDISVAPMIQGTYVLTQNDSASGDSVAVTDGSGNIDASDSYTVNYSLSNLIIQNDSAKDFEFNNPPYNEWWGDDTYALTPDRFIWGDYGRKMITMGYDYLRPINYYDLSTPYDASTAILDSSKSWSTDERDSAFGKLGLSVNGPHGLWDDNSPIVFNADGSNFTTIGYSSAIPGKRFTTIELSNNYDISSVESYTQTDLSNSTIQANFSNYGTSSNFPNGAGQVKWIDSGNKIVWQGNVGYRDHFLFIHVPTPYDFTSINWVDSSVWYKYENLDWLNDAIHTDLSPLEPAKGPTVGRVFPRDFSFSHDGKKMFATDTFDEDLDKTIVYQINMTEPYDLRTQTSETEIVTWPNNFGPYSIHGISVTPTGKLLLGHGSWYDSVTRTYDDTKGRWTQWDITTPDATYGTIDEATGAFQLEPSAFGSFYTEPKWFDFTEDGTKIFVKGNDPVPGYAQSGSRLGEFNLSTAYDITTFDSTPVNVEIHPDGESYEGKFGDSGNKWYATSGGLSQYNLPGPYDITNWSSSTTRNTYNLAGGNSFDFRPDGTELFAISTSSNTMGIRRYALGSPWQLNPNDNYDSQYNFDNEMTTTSSIEFNSSGTKMYVLARADANSNVGILEYDLSTPWRIGTATYNDKFLNLGNDGFLNEEDLTMRLVNDNIFYVLGKNTNYYVGGYPSKAIYKYTLGAAAAVTPPTPPVVYPQQSIQNLAYDSTQELTWSAVTNDYGLEVSPDGSTIVMKDLGQNDWRVFTMSTPYDLSTAVRDTNKEPTFGMTDSAHKFKSHGMTFSNDWTKLANSRIGTPLDIYKNEISVYDISGGTSTYSLDRIDNESDGNRTSSWGTLAFESQITDQDGTNHNQRPENIQFGDSGQRLYWTNLNGSTNLMSQWHLSSPYTIDLDMVDSGGLYMPSILSGDSSTLGAAVNHDGSRVYVLTSTATEARGVGIYQLDLADSWDVKTATWDSDKFLKLSNNNNHGTVTAARGDIAVTENYLFVSVTSDGSTVIRRYEIDDSIPPPPPPPTSNSDSDGLGYATAANWVITVDQGPLYEDSATEGNVFFGEAVASASDLTFGMQPSTANQRWSSGKISSLTQNVSSAATSTQTTQPVDVAAGDQGNIYVLDNYRTIEQYVTPDSADLSNLTHIRSFTLNDTDNQSLQFKRDGTQFYTVGSTTREIKTYDLSTPWDISTAVENTSKTFTVSDDTSPVGLVMSPYGNSMIVLGDINNTIYQYELDSDSFDPSTAGSSFASLNVSAVTNVNGQVALTQNAKRIRTSYDRGWNVYIMGVEGSSEKIHQGSITGGTPSGMWRNYDITNHGGNISTFNYNTLPENELSVSGTIGFDFSYSGRTMYSIHDGNFNYLYAGTMDIPNMSFGTI